VIKSGARESSAKTFDNNGARGKLYSPSGLVIDQFEKIFEHRAALYGRESPEVRTLISG
jgi:hypothetical protein